jgi:hypothetical protein
MIKTAPIKAIQLSSTERPKHVRLTSPNTAFTNEVKIDLLDGIGKAVDLELAFAVTSAHECEVDLSTLSSGVYHLRVLDEEVFFVKRIILN